MTRILSNERKHIIWDLELWKNNKIKEPFVKEGNKYKPKLS